MRRDDVAVDVNAAAHFTLVVGFEDLEAINCVWIFGDQVEQNFECDVTALDGTVATAFSVKNFVLH